MGSSELRPPQLIHSSRAPTEKHLLFSGYCCGCRVKYSTRQNEIIGRETFVNEAGEKDVLFESTMALALPAESYIVHSSMYLCSGGAPEKVYVKLCF